jgi:hypothetical protein
VVDPDNDQPIEGTRIVIHIQPRVVFHHLATKAQALEMTAMGATAIYIQEGSQVCRGDLSSDFSLPTSARPNHLSPLL